MNSPWADDWVEKNKQSYGGKAPAKAKLKAMWGGDLPANTPPFNSEVLPAVVEDQRAGVRIEELRDINIEYHYFPSPPGFADALLKHKVPLVVRVGIPGYTPGHHIVVFQNVDEVVWAVDPWWSNPDKAVVNLSHLDPPWESFGIEVSADLALSAHWGSGLTIIPHRYSPLFGYFRAGGRGGPDPHNPTAPPKSNDYQFKLDMRL